MQIFFRAPAQRFPERMFRFFGGVFAAGCLIAAVCAAQTLARPGWAGSGLTSTAWWQTALIYRVQPQWFQDSNGDGVGDLRGLAERLDYLQSIGVDAVLIESHASDAGFDDLLREASRHHIRIVVRMGEDEAGKTPSAQQELNEERMWLRRGVAGVYVPGEVLRSIAARASFGDAVALVQQMRSQANGFPGERIVITDDTPAVESAAGSSGGGARKSGPELVAGVVSTADWSADKLRAELTVADGPAAGEPLLEIGRLPVASAQSRATERGRDEILAALLLSSRGAVALGYGQEIGLPTATQAMQWTPTNLTKPEVAAAPSPPAVVYGPYRPYVRPAPVVSRAKMPNAVLDTELPPKPVDPDTLPGFSTRMAEPPDAAKNFDPANMNVALEDNDQESLLNFHRHVLELHEGNATLREGSVSFFDHDSENALVWLRRAPAGVRTVASVIVACNLSEHPVVISLDDDLARLHVRGGFLRPLLTSRHIDHVAQATGHMTLSPHSVYVGELFHYATYR
jgi:alpha-glucosidase